jgi:hypothetical protein
MSLAVNLQEELMIALIKIDCTLPKAPFSVTSFQAVPHITAPITWELVKDRFSLKSS